MSVSHPEHKSISRLRSALENRCADEIVWVDEAAGKISVAEIREKLAQFAGRTAKLSRQRVAVQCQSAQDYALALMLLDGLCSDLLLLSADLGESETQSLLKQFQADELVSSLADFPTADTTEEAPPLQTGWLIPTSGTTQQPRLIQHNLESLTRTLKAPQPGHQPCWGMLYEISRFAGLQVFLQALCGGGRLLLPKLESSLTQQLDFFARNGCDALSATPTLWRKILMLPAREKLSLRQVTLGGEIADQLLLDSLRKNFPDAGIRHLYASTEAGVGFSVSDGQAGFPAAWLANPPGEVQLKITDDQLWLKLPKRDSAEEIGSEVEVDADGFLLTGDRVEMRGDRVYFLGRANGSINVGGNKVYPEEVEQVLLGHPQVALTKVFGKPNPFTGAIVIADVVLSEQAADQSGLAKELIGYCRERLAPFKVPALINIKEALATTATGKLTRRDG
jgi:acyl-CoA synthetase (AMP-forming)/AMP-acid ligase II